MMTGQLPMTTRLVDPHVLDRLEPICALSAMRLRELAGQCSSEVVARGHDPFRLRGVRDSLATAFILSQRGYRAFCLEGLRPLLCLNGH